MIWLWKNESTKVQIKKTKKHLLASVTDQSDMVKKAVDDATLMANQTWCFGGLLKSDSSTLEVQGLGLKPLQYTIATIIPLLLWATDCA